MPKSKKEEKYSWIKPILDEKITIKNMVKVCQAKTDPQETPKRIKERIIELRKETKKCVLKLKWQLEKEGIVIPKNTIQKIIKKEGLLRTYRIRKLRYQ